MTTVKGIVVAAMLGGLLAACSSMPHAPTYSAAELQAACERQGGWWRGSLIPGYCESQSTTMP